MSIDVDTYRYELIKYRNIKNNVSQILVQLGKAVNAYEEIGKSVMDIYVIDDDNTDIYNKSVKINKSLEETSKKIKNDILPKINTQINYLHNKIIDLESEESE